MPQRPLPTPWEFIDPFFEALGWNVRNTGRDASQAEVIVEADLAGRLSSSAHRAHLQAAIAETDAALDALVYDLYGLTPEEIALVEGER